MSLSAEQTTTLFPQPMAQLHLPTFVVRHEPPVQAQTQRPTTDIPTQYPSATTDWFPTTLPDGVSTWLPSIYIQTFETSAAVGPLGPGWNCQGCRTSPGPCGAADQQQQQNQDSSAKQANNAESALRGLNEYSVIRTLHWAIGLALGVVLVNL